MGDMKEIRDAALAYYRNLSEEQQQGVYAFFKAMDKDGDGAITIKEFKQILKMSYSDDSVNTLFREMDKNGDGILNFEEAITFYYVCTNRRLLGCDGCKALFIKGLYFTCVDCFEHNQTTTFDLCISCYGSRNYVHEHCNFLDNYALLRTMPACRINQPASQVPRSRLRTRTALGVIKTGVEIGNTVGNVVSAASACIIM